MPEINMVDPGEHKANVIEALLLIRALIHRNISSTVQCQIVTTT